MEMSSSKRAIDKIYRRRDRYDIPDWQRTEVWNAQKKRALIDSILRGWRLPKCYFQITSESPGEYEVVDGQQRLSAIYEFFDGELSLTRSAAKKFAGSTYDTLTDDCRDAFDDFEIEFDVVDDADESEIKEFFQRLQAGLPLTSSDNLNAIHSNLRDFARTLAEHPFFSEKVWIADKRYAHFDIAAKVAAIELDGIDTGLRFDDLKETFQSQASFSAKSQAARRLVETFDYLDRVFPNKSPALRNRTIIQSFATLTAKLVATGNASGKEDALRHFFEGFPSELSKQIELGARATDTDYLSFQKSVNANVRSGPKARHSILLRKLFTFDPSFVELFDPTAVAEAGLPAQIAELAAQIQSEVEDSNARYGASNGTDLLKPTAKTVSALTALGKPILDHGDYKDLVDGLYFLVHESVGTRLTSGTPQSFLDVADLRTDLQHDLDHGKAGKVRKRRKATAEVFQKYAGTGTASTLDPIRFVVVQANLLKAISSDVAQVDRFL